MQPTGDFIMFESTGIASQASGFDMGTLMGSCAIVLWVSFMGVSAEEYVCVIHTEALLACTACF